jgi:hypothetical protein
LEQAEQGQDLMFLEIPVSIRQVDRVSIQLLPTAESLLLRREVEVDRQEIFPEKLNPEALEQVQAHS